MIEYVFHKLKYHEGSILFMKIVNKYRYELTETITIGLDGIE